MMVAKITSGVKVSIETYFQNQYSNPNAGEYMFGYRIRIENQNSYHIQLLTRQWFIFDSSNDRREIKGDGVVGKQPVIAPGGIHEYVSACHLHSDIGSMNGFYYFVRIPDKTEFRVQIPKFFLIPPFKLN